MFSFRKSSAPPPHSCVSSSHGPTGPAVWGVTAGPQYFFLVLSLGRDFALLLCW